MIVCQGLKDYPCASLTGDKDKMEMNNMRITYDNIRNGILKHVSNHAFADEILDQLTQTQNCTLDLRGIMEVISALPPVSFKFTRVELSEIERSIKLEAIFSDTIWETPDGKIH